MRVSWQHLVWRPWIPDEPAPICWFTSFLPHFLYISLHISPATAYFEAAYFVTGTASFLQMISKHDSRPGTHREQNGNTYLVLTTPKWDWVGFFFASFRNHGIILFQQILKLELFYPWESCYPQRSMKTWKQWSCKLHKISALGLKLSWIYSDSRTSPKTLRLSCHLQLVLLGRLTWWVNMSDDF